MDKAFIVRADGAWFSRVVRVYFGLGVTSSIVSAYSDVRLVRIGGAMYQPLRAGDLVVRGDAVLGSRPAVPDGQRQLVTAARIEVSTTGAR